MNLFFELIGTISVLFYLLRWVFQIYESRKQKKSVTPIIYWVLTIIAGGLSALYAFLLGSIILPISFLFTISIAFYNIYIELQKEAMK